jgi:hypothetical protein
MAIFYVNSDNVVEVQSLTDAVTSTLITTASVTVTLKDSDGVEVTGETWPLTLNHQGSGTYRGTISDTVMGNLSSGDTATATFTADDGAGKYREWCESIIVTCEA